MRSARSALTLPLTLTAVGLMAACAGDSTPTMPDGAASASKAAKAGGSNTATTFFLDNDVGLALRGDGRAVEPDGSSRYRDGECGVAALVYSRSGESGDAIMSSAYTKARNCADAPRQVRITYTRLNPDGTTTSEGDRTTSSFLNVRKLHQIGSNGTPLSVIPIGERAYRTFAFDDGGFKCGISGTGAITFGVHAGSDPVLVERTAADRYEVATEAGKAVAHCKANGAKYVMPVRFVILTGTALTP